MRWWINKDGDNTGVVFDDGVVEAAPGDEAFTRDGINAELRRLNGNKDVGPHTADFLGITEPELHE